MASPLKTAWGWEGFPGGGRVSMGERGFTVLVIHPHLDVVGGSEVLTRLLIEELSGMGVEVHVLSRGFPEELKGLRSVKLHYMKACGESFEDSVRAVADSVAGLGGVDADAALVMIQEPVYVAALRVFKPRVPVAIYIHFPVEEELTRENLPRFYSMCRFPTHYEHLYWIADVRLVNSFYTAGALQRLFGLQGVVVYPSIPWSYYEREPPPYRGRGPRAISVGRFVPQKRLDRLVELFAARVRPRVPGAELLIVGVPDPRYPEYHERLLELASRYDWLTVIDEPLAPERLAELYSTARVYVHMRIGEHFGMAPVEAMTQYTVPLIPRRTGLAEVIVDGRNGYLFDTDEEMVEKLTHILSSPKAGEEVAKRARTTSYYFTPARFASETLGYLRLIAAGRKRGLGAEG